MMLAFLAVSGAVAWAGLIGWAFWRLAFGFATVAVLERMPAVPAAREE